MSIWDFGAAFLKSELPFVVLNVEVNFQLKRSHIKLISSICYNFPLMEMFNRICFRDKWSSILTSYEHISLYFLRYCAKMYFLKIWKYWTNKNIHWLLRNIQRRLSLNAAMNMKIAVSEDVICLHMFWKFQSKWIKKSAWNEE
jgi:hypothetical protein